jgi:hypothetical protein
MRMVNLTDLVALSILNKLVMLWNISFLSWQTFFTKMSAPSPRMIVLTRISTNFSRRKWLSNLSSSAQPGSSRSKIFLNVVPKRMSSLTISMVLLTIWLRFGETGKAESRTLRSRQSACKNPAPPYLSIEPKDETVISRREGNTPKSIGQSLISSTTLKWNVRFHKREKKNRKDLQSCALRPLM